MSRTRKLDAGSVCLNHPDVPAVAHCATCRKPICADCAKTAEGITCCSNACLQNALDSGIVVGDIMARKKKSGLKRAVRNLITLLIILVLAWFAYQHRDRLMDLFRKGKAKTEQVSQEAVGQIKTKTDNYKKELDANDARRRAARDKKYGFDE